MSVYFLHCVFFQLLVAVFLGNYFQGNYGNGLVWLCLLLGPPLAVTTYFHDHYISFPSASSSPQMSDYGLPVFLQPHWSRGNVYHLMLYMTVLQRISKAAYVFPGIHFDVLITFWIYNPQPLPQFRNLYCICCFDSLMDLLYTGKYKYWLASYTMIIPHLANVDAKNSTFISEACWKWPENELQYGKAMIISAADHSCYNDVSQQHRWWCRCWHTALSTCG